VTEWLCSINPLGFLYLDKNHCYLIKLSSMVTLSYWPPAVNGQFKTLLTAFKSYLCSNMGSVINTVSGQSKFIYGCISIPVFNVQVSF